MAAKFVLCFVLAFVASQASARIIKTTPFSMEEVMEIKAKLDAALSTTIPKNEKIIEDISASVETVKTGLSVENLRKSWQDMIEAEIEKGPKLDECLAEQEDYLKELSEHISESGMFCADTAASDMATLQEQIDKVKKEIEPIQASLQGQIDECNKMEEPEKDDCFYELLYKIYEDAMNAINGAEYLDVLGEWALPHMGECITPLNEDRTEREKILLEELKECTAQEYYEMAFVNWF